MRASTTPPPGAGDGGAQDPACTNEGKLIIKPFSPKDLDQRGTGNSASGTAPTAFTGWSAPAANTYAYITQIQCHREDAGTTPYHVTLNDTVSTVVGLPPNGGNTISYGATPLRVSASATAPTFTSSNTGLNVYCDAQGYNGP